MRDTCRRARRALAVSVTVILPIVTVPELGARVQAMMDSSVVFPAPLGPRRPSIRPESIVRSSGAKTLTRPKFRDILSREIMGADLRNVIGCNMAFRATVFDTAGLFGEDLGRVGRVPYGCEETELCIRITRI